MSFARVLTFWLCVLRCRTDACLTAALVLPCIPCVPCACVFASSSLHHALLGPAGAHRSSDQGLPKGGVVVGGGLVLLGSPRVVHPQARGSVGRTRLWQHGTSWAPLPPSSPPPPHTHTHLLCRVSVQKAGAPTVPTVVDDVDDDGDDDEEDDAKFFLGTTCPAHPQHAVTQAGARGGCPCAA